MSRATVISGSLSFKKGTPEELKQRIIDELEEVLETELKYYEKLDIYEFEELCWKSHIDEEKIEATCQKWNTFFKEFSVSLYYLYDADYYESLGDEDQDTNSILSTLIDKIIGELKSNDSEYLDKLRALVEFLEFADVDKELVARKVFELIKTLKEYDLEESRDVLEDLIDVLEERFFPPAELKKLALAASV